MLYTPLALICSVLQLTLDMSAVSHWYGPQIITFFLSLRHRSHLRTSAGGIVSVVIRLLSPDENRQCLKLHSFILFTKRGIYRQYCLGHILEAPVRLLAFGSECCVAGNLGLLESEVDTLGHRRAI